MSFPETSLFSIATKKRQGAFRRFLRNPVPVFGAALSLAIIVLVMFADFFAPIDPTKTNLVDRLQGPSLKHLMGTDGVGRDEWSRLLHGGQLTLVGAAIVLLVSITLGVIAGLVTGYFGGWLDTVGSWFVALLMTLPLMIILLAVRATFGMNLVAMMFALGILITPGFYLLVRATVRGVKNDLYVDAARVSGLTDARIIRRHILLAIRAPLIIQSMMIASLSIGIQAALDFLGLGATDGPTWGGMLSESFEKVFDAPQLMFWPGLLIGVMTASLLLLGNAIRDAVEDRPRLKKSKELSQAAAANALLAPPALPHGALLSVNDLRVAYQTQNEGVKEVVHGISLTVREGKVLGLVGESGSGKTQIAFAILGLLPDTALVPTGTISFKGTNLLGLDAKARQKSRVGGLAYIPQEPMANLDPAFTIGDQLMEPLRFARGMSKSEAAARALSLLEKVAIDNAAEVMRRYPHEISGGMAQRVLIAVALAMEPVLLIADEPTTALDVTVQSEVLALLRHLQKTEGLSILLVTHDLGVAAEMCDDIVVLKDGLVVESGGVEDVFYQPKAGYTKSLLAATFASAAPREAWMPPRGEA